MNKLDDRKLDKVAGGSVDCNGDIQVSFIDSTLTVTTQYSLNRVHLTINNHSKFASLASDCVGIFNNVERVNDAPYQLKVVYSDSTYKKFSFTNPSNPFEKTF